MSCLNCRQSLTESEKEKRREHKAIEKELKKYKREFSKDIRVLLVGTGESGKSTFIKQVRMIHGGTFSAKEKQMFAKCIYKNIITAMQSMINAMDVLKIEYNNSPEIMEYVQLIKSINAEEVTHDSLNVNALKKLWDFEGIKESYRQRRRYQLADSTEYFFKNIDRLALKNYSPTEDDILRARVITKGVQEHVFPTKDFNIRFVDLAGQRPEREKWFDQFELCNVIIFISAISEYDQTLKEDNKVNRLKESIELFGVLANHSLFCNKPIILFLNKIDLLEIKIQESHLVDYFPNYEGPLNDAIAAREFIKHMFLGKKNNSTVPIFSFYTLATDKANIKNVYKSLQAIIVDMNLKGICCK